MGVFECNSYSQRYNPILHTSSPQMTRRGACTDTIFYHRRRFNLGPLAPEVSVLTTEVYRNSISYRNKTVDISVNLRFRLLLYHKIIFKWDFAAMTGIRLVRCNSADRGNKCR